MYPKTLFSTHMIYHHCDPFCALFCTFITDEG